MSNQPVTMKQLGEFTDQTLLPAVSMLVDDKLKKGFSDFEKKMDVKLNEKFADFSDTMDEKLSDLKGDLIILMRKGDRKLGTLVALLHQKHILSEEDAKQILALEPFPKP